MPLLSLRGGFNKPRTTKVLLLCLCLLNKAYSSTFQSSKPPLVISSEKFLLHRSVSFHPERPERISSCLPMIKELEESGSVRFAKPSAEGEDESRRTLALNAIKRVHDDSYIKHVKAMTSRGARLLSPYDEDTYINEHSFEQCLLAQSAWLDGVYEVCREGNPSFALTRPPGHHAVHGASMGFCIFNFAAAAAVYAVEELGLERVAILDWDVHYGNGVADLVSDRPQIRYASIHEADIFPYAGKADESGPLGNILNVPMKAGTKWAGYEPLLTSRVIPFLTSFNPQLVIICAGFDSLASDEMANVSLQPGDFEHMSELVRQAFGNRILFGLEGGYNVKDLPKAVRSTLTPFFHRP